MKRITLALLRFYKAAVSPYWPGACRFRPTCSEYAQEAVTTHGPAFGLWLAARRLAKCGPWHAGGWDPVPPRAGKSKSEGLIVRSG